MSQLPTSIAHTHHDHNQCIHSAMATARRLCSENGVRLTAIREQVLQLIWQSHRPLGAYELLDQLAQHTTKRVAPPTVYRALEFLLEQGLVHRINSLNAYIGCTHPNHQHADSFFLCRHCGIAIEFATPALQNALSQQAQTFGFAIEQQSVEVVGSCADCAGKHGEQP